MSTSERLAGQIVAAHGRNYLVELGDGALLKCVPRGKSATLVCGDRVSLAVTSPGEAVIEALIPRTTLFHRSATLREKLIAANATQAAVIVAAEPSFSDELVARALIAAEIAGMSALLVLNKIDLEEQAALARVRLQPLVRAGYPLVELSAKASVDPLVPRLLGQTTVMIGQSGMGKSTVINALFPQANARTDEISRFLDSGRHTTTHTRLYRMADGSALIDTPGVQEFGLAHVNRADVAGVMPDFRPFLGGCRFNNCRHLTEPGCAVTDAVRNGAIDARRYEIYTRIIASPV